MKRQKGSPLLEVYQPAGFTQGGSWSDSGSHLRWHQVNYLRKFVTKIVRWTEPRTSSVFMLILILVINMMLILMLGMEDGRRVVQKMGNPCDGREFYSKQIGVIDPRWSNILNQRLSPPQCSLTLFFFQIEWIDFIFENNQSFSLRIDTQDNQSFLIIIQYMTHT